MRERAELMGGTFALRQSERRVCRRASRRSGCAIGRRGARRRRSERGVARRLERS